MSELQTGDTNKLYLLILHKTYKSLEKQEKEDLDLILQAVASILVPLGVDTLSELLDLKERKVHGLLSGLHSVINIPEDNGVVTTLHASFPEYLKTQITLINPVTYPQKPQQSMTISQSPHSI